MVRGRFVYILFLVSGCTAKPYSHYLIEPEVDVPEAVRDDGKQQSLEHELKGSSERITMRWNNGKTHTEVSIPLEAAGRIIVDHEGQTADEKTEGPSLILPPPLASDTLHQSLHQDYVEKGLKMREVAPAVSLSQARRLLDEATRKKSYGEALLITEAVLERYPDHPIYLKAKGSLHLLLGNRDLARTTYERALEIEEDPAVERKLNELERF